MAHMVAIESSCGGVRAYQNLPILGPRNLGYGLQGLTSLGRSMVIITQL